MKLTDMGCKRAANKEHVYTLFDGKGLCLEIHPSGSKYWRMKYYITGKQTRIAIGIYPEV